MSARLIVTGGRDFSKRDFVFRKLDEFRAEHGEVELGHGACPTGADKLADDWARDRGVHVERFPALWNWLEAPGAQIRENRYGRPYNVLAGFQRNGEMLRKFMPTHVIAFDGNRGTADMVAKVNAAVRAGQAVELIDYRMTQ